MAPGLGVGFGLHKRSGGSSWTPQNLVTEHITRVVADGGIVESESVLLATMESLRDIYKIKNDADFKTKLPVTVDPSVFGYKVGTGAGSALGWAAAKLYSINATGDRVQATAANQPLLLTYNSTDGAYYFQPRTAGANLSYIIGTDGNVAVGYTNATDTLVIKAKILMTAQVSSGYDRIVYANDLWGLGIKNKGANKLIVFHGLSYRGTDSAEYTPSATVPHWVRMTCAPGGIEYAWSANGTDWTVLNSGVAYPTLGAGTTITICRFNNQKENSGKYYYIDVLNETTGGRKICDMNDWNPTVSETAFASSSGDGGRWSIVYDTLPTTYKGVMVNRSVCQGDGVNDVLTGNININQPHTIYTLVRRQGIGTLSGMAADSSISNDAINTTLNNGAALNIANASRDRQLLTITSNGANSKIRVDSGADTVGDGGSNNGTYLSLFANGAAYGNFNIAAYMISNGIDTEAQKSAIFSLYISEAPVLAITGDSIASRLERNAGAIMEGLTELTIFGQAVGGTGLAVVGGGHIYDDESFVNRSSALSTYKIDITNIDYLLVWAGFNDKGNNRQLGAIDTDDTTTVAGAIRVGVANYLARKPALKILFMNPSANPFSVNNALGLNIDDYAAWIKTVCESIDVPCYDMWANCGITEANKAEVLPDNVHPTAEYCVNPLAPLSSAFINANK